MEFLRNHIEKILLSLSLLGLMATAVLLSMRIGEVKQGPPELSINKRKVPPLDFKGLDNLVRVSEQPPDWENKRSLVTPPPYVWARDRNTGRAVLTPLGRAPVQARDKCPPEWLEKYGLPNKHGIGDEDTDRDGFTNFEEYKYKTDPKDPASFPQPSDYLAFVGPVQKKFYLRFQGYTQSADGQYTFQINVNVADYTYFVKLGGQIASDTRKENYWIDKFESAFVEEFDPAIGAKRQKEVSRLIIHRDKDPSPITLTYRQWSIDILPRAVLSNTLDEASGSFEVAKGDEFKARGKPYKVVDIKKDAVIISDSENHEYSLTAHKTGE